MNTDTHEYRPDQFACASDQQVSEFVRGLLKLRSKLRDALGAHYQEVVDLSAGVLQQFARQQGISIVQAFEINCAPANNRGEALAMADWSAALVELYELRERGTGCLIG